MIELAFLLVGCGAAAFGSWWATRSLALRGRWRKRVIVTLKSGEAVIGVLLESDRQALVLRSAEAIGAGENKTNLPVDGELVVLLADVAYLQRP